MIDILFGLIPDYGVFVIFAVVAIACLAVPLPASALVLASGGFAASGDLSLPQVLAAVFGAFIVGDQTAFALARRIGPKILAWLRRRQHARPILERGERLVGKYGVLAVLISHTVLSPTCAYASYVCGAGQMRWMPFTFTAAIGAAIWTSTYVGLGYVFASQLTQVSQILGRAFVLVLALIALAISGWMLRQRWRREHG